MGNKLLIQKIEELANIPKDVTEGLPYLSILGNTEIYIENYRGLLEYTHEIVRVQTQNGRIELNGTNLHVEYYSNDEMKIKGFIKEINFQIGG